MSTIINATTTNGVVIQPDNSGSLVLQTNSGTTALTIDTSQRAAFVAGTAALPAITTTGDTNTGIWFPAADTIAFAEGGAEIIRIDSSGYVTKPYQVAFLAYGGSGTAANPTIFTTTSINIGNAYNTSNGRFTAPIAGRYLISTMIHSGNGVGGTADFRLQKNGGTIEGGGACRSVSYYAQATGVVVVQLAAGDYLTVLTHTNFSNTQDYTSFSGYLLG